MMTVAPLISSHPLLILFSSPPFFLHSEPHFQVPSTSSCFVVIFALLFLPSFFMCQQQLLLQQQLSLKIRRWSSSSSKPKDKTTTPRLYRYISAKGEVTPDHLLMIISLCSPSSSLFLLLCFTRLSLLCNCMRSN